jgi:hypothetical protein
MKVTYKEIAEAAGVSVSKAEDDRRRGLFDKADLRSVAQYITRTLSGAAEHVRLAKKAVGIPESSPGEPTLGAAPKVRSFEWES